MPGPRVQRRAGGYTRKRWLAVGSCGACVFTEDNSHALHKGSSADRVRKKREGKDRTYPDSRVITALKYEAYFMLIDRRNDVLPPKKLTDGHYPEKMEP